MKYNFNNNVNSHYQLILLFNYSLGCNGIGSLKDIYIYITCILFCFFLIPCDASFRCIQVMDCFTVAVTNPVRL